MAQENPPEIIIIYGYPLQAIIVNANKVEHRIKLRERTVCNGLTCTTAETIALTEQPGVNKPAMHKCRYSELKTTSLYTNWKAKCTGRKRQLEDLATINRDISLTKTQWISYRMSRVPSHAVQCSRVMAVSKLYYVSRLKRS